MAQIEQEMNKENELKNDKLAKKAECDQIEDEINSIRKDLSQKQRDITNAQKGLMQIECRLESKKADRHGVLLHCKMECIDLPLKEGNLDDIVRGSSSGANNSDGNNVNGNADDDDDDDDGPSQSSSYNNDSRIKPDFDMLKGQLKHVS